MTTPLTDIFLIIPGLISGFSSVMFGFSTFIVVTMLGGVWSSNSFTFKEKYCVAVLMSVVGMWGGWLTYITAAFAISCFS